LLALGATLAACPNKQPSPPGPPPPPPIEEMLCRELPTSAEVASVGSFYRAGAFIMLDLALAGGSTAGGRCGVLDLRGLYEKVRACLSGGSCGEPFDTGKLRILLEPIEKGVSDVAVIAGVPVEVYTTSTRLRIAMAPGGDVLGVMRHLDPSLQQLPGDPTGPTGPTVPRPAGAVAVAGEVGVEEVATGGCCGGLCTPCEQGQCEPRPGVIIRNSVIVDYQCNCDGVREHCAALPQDDCPCREKCLPDGCP
jgi:hypothetical protein